MQLGPLIAPSALRGIRKSIGNGETKKMIKGHNKKIINITQKKGLWEGGGKERIKRECRRVR
jgi:hypothetical protein